MTAASKPPRLPDLAAWIGVAPFFLFAAMFLVLPTASLLVGAFQDYDGAFTLANIMRLGQAPPPQLAGEGGAGASDGVWPAASTQVGLHNRHCEPTSSHTCFPHPIRPSGPPSPLRGEGGDPLTCVNAVAASRA